MSSPRRIESDFLGEVSLPADALHGVHTVRAVENFGGLSGAPAHPAMVAAYGAVKWACARTNADLGAWADDIPKAEAMLAACQEMSGGAMTGHVPIDALAGGAGTSLNMCVNEVLANRALVLLGEAPGSRRVHPLDDLNRHQSTNDTYPTALKLAAHRRLAALEQAVLGLQEAFQHQEQALADVVKVGRTEYQDAVLTTLGREMGAWAEAFNRDRWRIYKCCERLRAVNLGGTAIGTGLAAPRQYIFRVTDTLRAFTGVPFARAENLVDATQNADVFAEVSGMLKTCAVSLLKVSGDLRFLASGPEAGVGELRLPARQAGSSIMPGKVNPVIPEAVSQAAMLVLGHDSVIAMACAQGHLELNPYLPLIAKCLLESCDLLERACTMLAERCVRGIEADRVRCAAHVANSTATATALVSVLGYEGAARIAHIARASCRGLRDVALAEGGLSPETFDALVSPEAVCRLGMPPAQEPI